MAGQICTIPACLSTMTALTWLMTALTYPKGGTDGMISEEMLQAYRRDGVIVVPDVLDKDTLATVRTVLAELVAGAADVTEHTDVYDLEPGHTSDNPRVRRI